MQDQPFYLFLGEADREGIVSKLKSVGARYVKKRLESKVDNWRKIEKILQNDALQGVIAKMTTYSFALMVSDNYKDVMGSILSISSKSKNIFFVHESFFAHVPVPTVEIPNEVGEYFSYPMFYELTDIERSRVREILKESGVNIVVYKKNVEITILAQEFIDQSNKNIIFRIYVPNQRMWAREVEKLLNIFRDYLSNVGKFSVRQNQHATGNGVVYELVGDEALSPEKMPAEFSEFSRLMDLCVYNPEAARNILVEKNFEQRAIVDIIDRYSKEARRLQIDLKQERERRVLSIRHRMEAELADVVTNQADWDHLNYIADAQVPRVTGVGGALGFSGETLGVSPQNLTVNINPQFIETVNGIVAQEVSGTQNIGVEASQIIELIRLYGGGRAGELTSAVYELEDNRAEPPERMSAAARLKSFLYMAAEKATDVGFGLLQAYLEKKIGL